jgi:hypothetical protein
MGHLFDERLLGLLAIPLIGRYCVKGILGENLLSFVSSPAMDSTEIAIIQAWRMALRRKTAGLSPRQEAY